MLHKDFSPQKTWFEMTVKRVLQHTRQAGPRSIKQLILYIKSFLHNFSPRYRVRFNISTVNGNIRKRVNMYEYDIKRYNKKKRIIIGVVFFVLALIVMNLVMYFLLN
ncbi:hypothetical protein C0389_09790 [bacterium]|nr:hypothetical protein [bacterium]